MRRHAGKRNNTKAQELSDKIFADVTQSDVFLAHRETNIRQELSLPLDVNFLSSQELLIIHRSESGKSHWLSSVFVGVCDHRHILSKKPQMTVHSETGVFQMSPAYFHYQRLHIVFGRKKQLQHLTFATIRGLWLSEIELNYLLVWQLLCRKANLMLLSLIHPVSNIRLQHLKLCNLALL